MPSKPLQCANCHRFFTASGEYRTRTKYCSSKCRQQAYRARKRPAPAPAVPAPAPEPAPEPAPAPRETAPAPAYVLDAPRRHEFDLQMEREMDESLEQVLRHTKKRLREALDDPGASPSALPAIAKELVNVTKDLESVTKGAATDLSALLAGDDATEESEVADDASAII